MEDSGVELVMSCPSCWEDKIAREKVLRSLGGDSFRLTSFITLQPKGTLYDEKDIIFILIDVMVKRPVELSANNDYSLYACYLGYL